MTQGYTQTSLESVFNREGKLMDRSIRLFWTLTYLFVPYRYVILSLLHDSERRRTYFELLYDSLSLVSIFWCIIY